VAITFVSRRANAANAAAALTYTIAVSAGTTGNLLLVIVHIAVPSSGSNNAASVSDNGVGSAWQRDITRNAATTGTLVGHAVFSTALGATPPTSLTLTMAGATSVVGYQVLEFAGTATSSWFDASSTITQGAAGTSFTTSSVTPAAAGELALLNVGLTAAATAWTPGGSYVSTGAVLGVQHEVGAAYILSGSSGAQTASASWTTTVVPTGALTFYKALAAAGATDHNLTSTGVGH
jgi:hypothetical protein